MAFDETGGRFYGTKVATVMQCTYTSIATLSSTISSFSALTTGSMTGSVSTLSTLSCRCLAGATTISERPLMFTTVMSVSALLTAGSSTVLGYIDGSRYSGYYIRNPWFSNHTAATTVNSGTYTVVLTSGATAFTLSEFMITTGCPQRTVFWLPPQYNIFAAAISVPDTLSCRTFALSNTVYTITGNRRNTSAADADGPVQMTFMLEPPFGYTGATR